MKWPAGGFLPRAARMIVAPTAEWKIIAHQRVRTVAMLASYVMPLALIPAAGWSLGLAKFGVAGQAGVEAKALIHGALLAFVGTLLWIGLSAASMALLARVFGAGRDWLRALQVAAYSATPVMLTGCALVWPDLLSVLVIAFFHSLYLQYGGVRYVLNVKESQAAEFVALSTVTLMVASTVLGAIATALGWI